VLPIRVGAYAIVLNDSGTHVLMCHTRSGSRIIKNFPGGALDQGETPHQALLREFQEEVRVAIDSTSVTHLHSSDGGYVNPDYPSNRLQCHYFLVKLAGDIPLEGNGSDVAKLEWVPLVALPIEEMLEPDREVGEMVRQRTTKA